MTTETRTGAVTTRLRTDGDVAILDVEGRLMGDPGTRAIQDEVKELLKQGRKKILLNLEKVPWVNSVSITVLVAALASARREGACLEICCLSKRVDLIMRTAVLIPDVFAGFSTERQALDGFHQDSRGTR